MPKGVYQRTIKHRRKISQLRKGKSSWSLGLTAQTDERIRKIAEMKIGKSRPDLIERNRNNAGKQNPHTVEHGRNISRGKLGKSSLAIVSATRNNWLNPSYRARVERHAGIGRKGYYLSAKNRCRVFYRSSYELTAYIKLEQDPTVLRYGTCQFSIPYLIDGKASVYIPDIFVELTDERKLLLEIKAGWQLNISALLRVIIAKKLAAEEYCRKIGAEYQIWTEKQLF